MICASSGPDSWPRHIEQPGSRTHPSARIPDRPFGFSGRGPPLNQPHKILDPRHRSPRATGRSGAAITDRPLCNADEATSTLTPSQPPCGPLDVSCSSRALVGSSSRGSQAHRCRSLAGVSQVTVGRQSEAIGNGTSSRSVLRPAATCPLPPPLPVARLEPSPAVQVAKVWHRGLT